MTVWTTQSELNLTFSNLLHSFTCGNKSDLFHFSFNMNSQIRFQMILISFKHIFHDCDLHFPWQQQKLILEQWNIPFLVRWIGKNGYFHYIIQHQFLLKIRLLFVSIHHLWQTCRVVWSRHAVQFKSIWCESYLKVIWAQKLGHIYLQYERSLLYVFV